MDITLQTKVAALLEAYPHLETTLLELSPVFSKLQNPVLRRTVAKVTSLQQAAGVAGISPGQLIQTLRQAAGLSVGEIGSDNVEKGQEGSPTWFDETKIRIRFDAVSVINSGGSPMQDILRLSKELQKGDILELTVPFKPVPIMDLLQSKGYQVWYHDGKTYVGL